MSNLDEISNKYEEYLHLNYKVSLDDDDEEPFKTKYEARKLLIELKQTLNTQLPLHEKDSNSYYNDLEEFIQKTYNKNAKSFLIEKLLSLYLAKNYLETEEYETGERLLAVDLRQLEELLVLEDDKTNSVRKYNPILYALVINVLNELVFVWSNRSDYEKCLKLLARSKEIYDFYTANVNATEQPQSPPPYQLNELIKIDLKLTNEKRFLLFESLYTHCMFYMAQIYGKLNDKDKSADYCRLTLQRQLDFSNTNDNQIDQHTTNLNEETNISFDVIDWATHCAALSQFYLNENEFSTSKHCLACSEALLLSLKDKKSTLDDTTQARLDEQFARIRRCWGKYGIGLLRYSKEQLCDETKNHSDLLKDLDKPALFHFNVSKININIEKYDKQFISSNFALDYDQAKKIFQRTLDALQLAKGFFQLDGYVTEHCEILRDICELYGQLAFFDENLENKSKLLKRRLDILKPVADELNDQFYLILKRQLAYDIAEIYSDMMDIKIELFNKKRETVSANDKAAMASMIAKINQLAKNAIQYFQLFLHTMKLMPDRVKLPETYDDDNVRPALLAHFFIGRLYSKLICSETSDKLNNVKISYGYYEYLVNYCEQHPDDTVRDGEFNVMEVMKAEYNVCKEMITFMPVKMENLRKAIR